MSDAGRAGPSFVVAGSSAGSRPRRARPPVGNARRSGYAGLWGPPGSGGSTHKIRVIGGVEPDWGAGPQPRHPCTAVGWNDDTFYLIVVDGRQKGLSAGMTFHELAELARRLGRTDALNLDGGGSTTLWLGGTVMNSPSDGAERPVANALLVVQDGGVVTPAPAGAAGTP